MATVRRRLLRPHPPRPAAATKNWLESFVAYAAGECHLAENTVAAYRRDLAHFFEWLQRRQHSGPVDSRSGRLRRLAARPGVGPRQHRPAHRVAEGLLPLLAVGRRDGRQPGGAAGQPETVGARAQDPQQRANRPAVFRPGPDRSVLAPRPGAVGAALRHGLPGLGAFPPPLAGHAPRRGFLHLPRQGRQGTHGAA